MTASAPLVAGIDDLGRWFDDLICRVAEQLRVEAAPVRLRLLRNATARSFTHPASGGQPPVIVVSSDRLTADIVAHEIAHALIPTPHLFLGEGIAGHIGCQVAGDCRHLLFPHANLAELLRAERDRLPPFEDLINRGIDVPGPFGNDAFATFEGRLGHAVAASFAQFCLGTYAGYAEAIGRLADLTPPKVLEAATGTPWPRLVAAWRASIEGAGHERG